MIKRLLNTNVLNDIDFDKAIIIKGARQVGKTTLINKILEGKSSVLWIDGDDSSVRNIWGNISKDNIKLFISDYKYIVIDEAQRINNIGITVKIIIDLKLKKTGHHKWQFFA